MKRLARGFSLVEVLLALALGLVLILGASQILISARSVSYTHLRAHETRHDLVCRLLLEKKKYTSPSPRDKRQSRMPSSA